MSRQQRTNYRRQRPTHSTPVVFPDLTWTIASVTDVSINLTIAGSFNGLVYEPRPEFSLVGVENNLLSVDWTPPEPGETENLMILSFEDDLPADFVLQLPFRSPKLRNSGGGVLTAGRETWSAPTPPPLLMTPTLLTPVLSDLLITLDTSTVNVGFYNANAVIANQTTAEFGSITSWDGVNLTVAFPISGLNSGDLIVVFAEAPEIFNSDGGHLAAFSQPVP